MKHTILLLFFMISFIGMSAEPFEAQVAEEDFGPLIQIEKMVEANTDLDAQDLLISHPELMADVQITSEGSLATFLDDDTLGIAPFWWGFCLGVWGIIIVLIITDKDKSAIGKAFKGMLTCLGIVAAAYLILIIAGVTLGTASF